MKKVKLVYLMLCLLAPFTMMAEKRPFVNGLYWELSDSGVLTISGNGAIPDDVTPWDHPWDDVSVRKIVIEYGVTSIGKSAFRFHHNLQSVAISNTITSIGDDAFRDCGKLQSVSIPESVKSIGSCAFTLCESLQSIEVPFSVERIGSNAFSGCNNNNLEILRPIKGPSQSQYYIVWKYYGYKGLKAYDGTWILPLIYNEITPLTKGYLKIEEKGRYGLVTYEGKVIVPAELDALSQAGIGYLRYKLNGFWGVIDYTGKIIIDTDRGYTSIGDFKSFNKRFAYTMAGYKGECDATGRQIVQVAATQETTQQQFMLSIIGTLYLCRNGCSVPAAGAQETAVIVPVREPPILVQTYIDVPCAEVEADVQLALDKVEDITLCINKKKENMKHRIIIYLIICLLIPVPIEAKKKPFGNGLYWELFDNGTLTISGNGVMPDYYYHTLKKRPWHKKNIYKIIIENGVTKIGNESFRECSTLTSVILPQSVVSIGSSAFMECNNLVSIQIPNSINRIASETFYKCSSLTSIIIPNSVSSIGAHAFYGCKKISSIVIPNSVTSIGYSAFMFCENASSIQISNSVKVIEKDAFKWCKKAVLLEFPPNILSQYNSSELSNFTGIPVNSIETYKNSVIDNTGKLIMAAKEGRTITKCSDPNKNNDYYIIDENGQIGLINAKGQWIIPKDAYSSIESIGGGYVRITHKNRACSVRKLDGQEIIPSSRGYASIGNYNSAKGTFAFTKRGMKGICDAQGKEISTTRLAPTSDDIKTNGGYTSAVAMNNGSTKYYKVNKSGRYGLTDSEGREVIPCEMDALESAGTGYLKYKLNGFWGLMNFTGKILIDTDRGYTSIGDYKSFNKRFAYTMTGYKGECDATGRQISKIKVETPKQNTSVASSLVQVAATQETTQQQFMLSIIGTLYLCRNGCSVPVAGALEVAVTVPVREPPILVQTYIDVPCVEVEVDVQLALDKVEDITLCINSCEI